MELLRAGFVNRLAAVCQAMEALTDVAETADSVLEWAKAMDPGERRELVEEIGRLGLMGGLLNSTQRGAQPTIPTKRRPAMQSLDGKGLRASSADGAVLSQQSNGLRRSRLIGVDGKGLEDFSGSQSSEGRDGTGRDGKGREGIALISTGP
jgi:hypothetical protein